MEASGPRRRGRRAGELHIAAMLRVDFLPSFQGLRAAEDRNPAEPEPVSTHKAP